jgi:outer membrane protein assembly factor BamB
VDPTDGTLLWSYETGDQINTTPAVVNGWVYVGSFDTNFYAFHLPG